MVTISRKSYKTVTKKFTLISIFSVLMVSKNNTNCTKNCTIMICYCVKCHNLEFKIILKYYELNHTKTVYFNSY